MTQPPGGVPGHPEPEPVPVPDPDPPMPIPPPDPAPHPEPPHAAPAGPAEATAAAGADFIDAAPTTDVSFPPIGAFADERPTEPPAAAPGWHQPPPSGPFHARHEKPGEWRYEPPEHLAHEHSPPAEVQDPTQVVTAWPDGRVADPGDRRRRSGLWLSVALTTTLMLCGGGAFSAYLLLRDAGSGGAPDPATAVNEFLTAAYTRQDPKAAGELVCREAHDEEKLAARVDRIRDYANEYDAPTFRWDDPSVGDQSDDRATVSVRMTMSTDDEKTAQQQLTITTVRKTGWLVCDVTG